MPFSRLEVVESQSRSVVGETCSKQSNKAVLITCDLLALIVLLYSLELCLMLLDRLIDRYAKEDIGGANIHTLSLCHGVSMVCICDSITSRILSLVALSSWSAVSTVCLSITILTAFAKALAKQASKQIQQEQSKAK